MTHREPQMSFPRFLDVKGLLNQDFLLLFGAETASKMLEKWDTTFRPKVINEARRLTQSIEVCRLLKTAEKLTENDDTTWDSDMASLLLRLHLLPPTAGQKRTKISPSDAVDKMLHFHKVFPWILPRQEKSTPQRSNAYSQGCEDMEAVRCFLFLLGSNVEVTPNPKEELTFM
ncbi:uncharacterized protein [Pagrus major]